MEEKAAVSGPAGPSGGEPRPRLAFARAFVRLAAPYWSGEGKWKIRGLTAALVALTVGQVMIPIAINLWSVRLFDALEQRAMREFLTLVGVLVLVILANVVIVTTHLRVKRRLQVGWRNWLTRQVLERWMSAGRYHHLKSSPDEHDNPDGRIAEDIRIATEYCIDLAHSLFYCVLLLASFTQLLWELSGPPHVDIAGMHLYVPGHLVWVAMAYATAGTAAGLLLGRPLVRAADWRQNREAGFRFGLVHVRENALAIALRRGEADERRSLSERFGDLVLAWDRQTTALRNLFVFSSSWSVLSQAFPVLVAAPRYIAGTISLGVLMQTAQAFQQMIAALAWPIDNLPKLADWRASVERVLGLADALARLPAPADRPTISVGTVNAPGVVFRDLEVVRPSGEIVLDRLSTEIKPGERVLISGDPATAATLFEVVGGLWPWGRGHVELPEGASIFLMPARPYLPPGALRGAIACPPIAPPADDAAFRAALRRVGLEHLIPRLDETGVWGQTLSAGEQQRISFARLLLHRPRWIFIHEAIDALDPQGKAQMMRLLREEFPDATVVTIGEEGVLTDFYGRRLVVVPTAGGALIEEAKPQQP